MRKCSAQIVVLGFVRGTQFPGLEKLLKNPSFKKSSTIAMKCTYLHLPTYGLCSFAKEQSVSKYNSRQITLFSSLYSSIFLYLSLSRYLYIALSLSLSLSLYLYLYLPLSLSLVLFDFIFISSSALNLSLFLYHSLCVFLSRHFKF